MGLNIYHVISPFLTDSLGDELSTVAGRRSFVFFVRAY
jgi:hypothetical protein